METDSRALHVSSTVSWVPQEFPWVVADPPEGDTPQVGVLPRIVPLKSLKTNLLNVSGLLSKPCLCVVECVLPPCAWTDAFNGVHG